MFPRRGSGVVFGEDLLGDRTAQFQHLIDQERQQHQRSETTRQVQDPVPEVVFQLVALVLQRVKGFVLNLSATACTGVCLDRGGPAAIPASCEKVELAGV